MSIEPSSHQIPVNFLADGDENIGPLTWNLTKGKLNLSPGMGVGSDKWGMTIDQDMTRIGSDGVQIDAAPESVSFGGNSINKLTTEVPPTSLTPFSILSPDNSKYLFLFALGSEIMNGLNEIDRDEYNTDIKYVYQVFDYDYICISP